MQKGTDLKVEDFCQEKRFTFEKVYLTCHYALTLLQIELLGWKASLISPLQFQFLNLEGEKK